MRNKKIICIFLIFFILIIFLFFKEYQYLTKANKLKERNKLLWSMDYYSYVIICYIPFSPFVKKAKNEILRISEKFEKDKKFYEALYGYELLKASLFQVRSFYLPDKDLIKRLNFKIAKIKSVILKDKKEFNNQYKILNYNNFSSILNEICTVFLFFLWIFLVIFTIFKKISKEKKIYLSFIVCFIFILWLISLYYE